MPYNTRRKSLSLPSLGIHIPVTHAERAAATAAAAATSSLPSCLDDGISDRKTVDKGQSQSKKRVKRHHGNSHSLAHFSLVVPLSPNAVTTPARGPTCHRTPPPSPKHKQAIDVVNGFDGGNRPMIDIEGISDEIITAVIVQLQDTGNRPHLVKELAAVLSQQLSSVQHSANCCAIIASRLAMYLGRSCWSAIAPCPLAKRLDSVHPRRTYFYLTTYPPQTLHESAANWRPRRATISPSTSASSQSNVDHESDGRRELSPSPEVDLSSPVLDNADDDVAIHSTPTGSHPPPSVLARDQRETSPPLEKDEREFTQTADGLQKRKLSIERPVAETAEQAMEVDDVPQSDLWLGEMKNSATAHILLMPLALSPAARPFFAGAYVKRDIEVDGWPRAGGLLEWDITPETIELEELDCLLDAC